MEGINEVGAGPRIGGAICVSIPSIIFLAFFAHQLKIDNTYSSADDCCAYEVSGSWTAGPCTSVIGSSYNVTSEFRMVCVWGVAIFTLQLAANLMATV